jgi:hypothetical protein
VKDDFKGVKEESKRYEKARSTYDSSLSKLTSLHKKDIAKAPEIESEVRSSRLQYEQTLLDYTCSLNSLQTKQRIDLSERVCTLLLSFMSYFHQGNVLFQVFQILSHTKSPLTLSFFHSSGCRKEDKRVLRSGEGSGGCVSASARANVLHQGRFKARETFGNITRAIETLPLPVPYLFVRYYVEKRQLSIQNISYSSLHSRWIGYVQKCRRRRSHTERRVRRRERERERWGTGRQRQGRGKERSGHCGDRTASE